MAYPHREACSRLMWRDRPLETMHSVRYQPAKLSGRRLSRYSRPILCSNDDQMRSIFTRCVSINRSIIGHDRSTAPQYVHTVVLVKWWQVFHSVERCNPWPHVANRHISISQLLSLWRHFHYDVICEAYGARNPRHARTWKSSWLQSR